MMEASGGSVKPLPYTARIVSCMLRGSAGALESRIRLVCGLKCFMLAAGGPFDRQMRARRAASPLFFLNLPILGLEGPQG